MSHISRSPLPICLMDLAPSSFWLQRFHRDFPFKSLNKSLHMQNGINLHSNYLLNIAVISPTQHTYSQPRGHK